METVRIDVSREKLFKKYMEVYDEKIFFSMQNKDLGDLYSLLRKKILNDPLNSEGLKDIVNCSLALHVKVMQVVNLPDDPFSAFMFALGSYTEQESKKEDTWRDQTPNQLYMHLKHEIEEIRRNLYNDDEIRFLLHNTVDALLLSLILLSRSSDFSFSGKENMR